MTAFAPEVAAALDIAKRLAAAGLPIFVAPADGSKLGFALPGNWERTKPDSAVVDSWRPGMALCAVGGHLCDFLDVDPRNGGHESAARLNGQWPTTYGRQSTPSGGDHYLIAPLRTGKGTPVAGIDLQGGRPDGTGRGFVFLAPTVRASKVDGVARPYAWVTEPDLGRLVASAPSDRSGEALAARMPERKGMREPTAGDFSGMLDGDRRVHTVEQAHRTITGKLAEVTEHARRGWSGFRTTLFNSANAIGAYVDQPAGIAYADAVAHLEAAIRLAGHAPDDTDRHWIETGIERGVKDPFRIVPDRVAAPQTVPTVTSRRRDLRPYFDGTRVTLTPSVGAKRSDGVQHLYPAKWHTVIGLTTAGKSLFAVWQAAAVLRAGGTVVYLHFEESSEDGTMERLCALGGPLGLDPETICERFVWLPCDAKWHDGELAAELALLPTPPELVILDGINEAAGQLGAKANDPETVTLYRKILVTPATSLGAAVLSLGHPVKDRTRQGERHSFGSTAWLDCVDGVSFRMEASPSGPIRKGCSGSSALYTVKDRYGEVDRHGTPTSDREAGWCYLGQFVVDDAPVKVEETNPFVGADTPATATVPREGTAAFLAAPKPRTATAEDAKPSASKDAGDEAAVFDAVAAFKDAHGRPPSTKQIHATTEGVGKDRVNSALVRLTLNGELASSPGDRGATLYDITTSAGDQLEESSQA